MAQKLTSTEVRQILISFLDGSGGQWEWDDFTSTPIADSALDRIRERCAGLWEEFPPDRPNEYCSDAGVDIIQEYIKQLSAPEPPMQSIA
jgi:hypothetical protein